MQPCKVSFRRSIRETSKALCNIYISSASIVPLFYSPEILISIQTKTTSSTNNTVTESLLHLHVIVDVKNPCFIDNRSRGRIY